jgi:hypothetical protein
MPLLWVLSIKMLGEAQVQSIIACALAKVRKKAWIAGGPAAAARQHSRSMCSAHAGQRTAR